MLLARRIFGQKTWCLVNIESDSQLRDLISLGVGTSSLYPYEEEDDDN
jgi:hypothetical protein